MKKLLLVAGLLVAVGAGLGGYKLWRKVGQTPQAYFERGKKYFDEKKYAEAKIEFMNVVQRDPRNKEGRDYLAQIFAMQGDFNRAAAQWKASLEYYPDDVTTSLHLAKLYLTVAGNQPKIVEEAQQLVLKILKKDPNNVDALVLSGAASGDKRDYDTSVATLEKATSLDPKNT